MRDPFDYFGVMIGLALGVVFAIIFYRIGEEDYGKGILTTLASVAVTLMTCFWLGMGMLGVILGQAVLFGILWMYNAERDKKQR